MHKLVNGVSYTYKKVKTIKYFFDFCFCFCLATVDKNVEQLNSQTLLVEMHIGINTLENFLALLNQTYVYRMS